MAVLEPQLAVALVAQQQVERLIHLAALDSLALLAPLAVLVQAVQQEALELQMAHPQVAAVAAAALILRTLKAAMVRKAKFHLHIHRELKL